MDKTFRIVCRPKNDPNDQEECVIEAMIGDDGRLKKNVCPGWIGKHSGGGWFYPFLLLPDGRVDFGSLAEVGRYSMVNIFDKNIKVGEIFTSQIPSQLGYEGGAEIVYQIMRIEPLT